MAAHHPDYVDVARLYAAHTAAVELYRHHFVRSDGPRHYLTRRGFPHLVRDDLPWWVGYAPAGGTALTTHLTRHGYQNSELLAAGLATTSRTGAVIDRFRDRIVFPLRDFHGHVVAFTGRAAPHAAQHVPKYLNSSDTAIFHKGQILYGLAEHIRGPDAAPVLVEGPLDVHAIHLAYPDARLVGLAPCGTVLTPHHVELLHGLAGTRHGVTIAFDPDPAGQAATERAWRLLDRTGIPLYAAGLPEGTDPASLITRPHGQTTLRTAIDNRRPLVEAVIDIHIRGLTHRHPDLLDHVDGRVAATRSIATLLTDLHPAEITRLLGYVAERTRVGTDTAGIALIDALEQATRQPGLTHAVLDHSRTAEPGLPGTQGSMRPRDAAARAFTTRLRLTPGTPPLPGPDITSIGPLAPRRGAIEVPHVRQPHNPATR